uniref:Uncharacterized protein n=1 Tax=Arion vulgaris TaxID=1028688 RepID=A0A0B7ABQ4_9EUPU
MPVRRHEPIYVPTRASKYATHHDYGIEDSINRADYLSSAVLQDTYEAAQSSRGKDHALLRNLNAAIVSTEQHVNPRVAAVSRRVRASTAPPTSRPLPGQQVQQQQYIQVAKPLLAMQYPTGPVLIMLAPNSRYKCINSNITASKPVVLSQAEAPWYLRARGGSVPPAENRNVRAASVPPRPRKVQQVYTPPEPLPTEKLRAHRPLRSDLLRTRASSLEPVRRPYYLEELPTESIRSTQLWAHRPVTLRKDDSLRAKAKAQERQSYPGSWRTATSVPRSYERASDYYFTIPDVQERALSRYLYAHRGRFGPDSKPPRPSLGNFPQAAIIGSRLESSDGARAQRRPRSDYVANKLRDLKREDTERKYK